MTDSSTPTTELPRRVWPRPDGRVLASVIVLALAAPAYLARGDIEAALAPFIIVGIAVITAAAWVLPVLVVSSTLTRLLGLDRS